MQIKSAKFYSCSNIRNFNPCNSRKNSQAEQVSFARNRFKETKLSPEIKSALDNQSFSIMTSKGREHRGTLKEYLEKSIMHKKDARHCGGFYHCTTSHETARNIINEGLDWSKTTNKNCGPGIYFAPHPEVAREQAFGGSIIEAVYIGKAREYPVMDKHFYNLICDEYTQFINFLEIQSRKNPSKKEELQEYALVVEEFVDKYLHDTMQEDMGVDFFYASTNRSAGSFVVVNDKSVRLHPYGW